MKRTPPDVVVGADGEQRGRGGPVLQRLGLEVDVAAALLDDGREFERQAGGQGPVGGEFHGPVLVLEPAAPVEGGGRGLRSGVEAGGRRLRAGARVDGPVVGVVADELHVAEQGEAEFLGVPVGDAAVKLPAGIGQPPQDQIPVVVPPVIDLEPDIEQGQGGPVGVGLDEVLVQVGDIEGAVEALEVIDAAGVEPGVFDTEAGTPAQVLVFDPRRDRIEGGVGPLHEQLLFPGLLRVETVAVGVQPVETGADPVPAGEAVFRFQPRILLGVGIAGPAAVNRHALRGLRPLLGTDQAPGFEGDEEFDVGGPVQAPVVVVVGADIQPVERREPVGSLGRRIFHLAAERVGTRRGGRVYGGARGVEHLVQHRDPVGDPVVGDAPGERRVPGECAQHAARAHAVVDVVGGEGRGVHAETEEGVLEIQKHVFVAEIAPQKARRNVPPAGLVPGFQRSAAGRIVDGVGEIDEPVSGAGPQGGGIHLVDARLGHVPAAEQDVPGGAAGELHAPLEVAPVGQEME